MADFQANADYFAQKKVTLIAGSADPLDKALETARLYHISFSLAYGLDPSAVSEKTGSFFNPQKNYIHATGFVIDREGVIYNAVYSTRSIGRLTARDCIGLIEF